MEIERCSNCGSSQGIIQMGGVARKCSICNCQFTVEPKEEHHDND